MKLGYDNIDDAKGKLVGTHCMFKGRAFTIENLHWMEGTLPDDNKYAVTGAYMSPRGKLGWTPIDDPEFNCSRYNIGYVNAHGIAGWFYRIPQKQYHQGLRYNQVGFKISNSSFRGIEFKHGAPVGKMLENEYPDFKKAITYLKEGEAGLIAFHKNFAMSRDTVHDDFIIEYKGEPIGFTHDLKNFQLMEECQHLMESLKEAAA